MKRLFALVVAAVFLGILPLAAQAAETTVTVEYLEDGSYIVTEIEISTSRTMTKVGSKSRTYYGSDDVAQWKIVVTGEFLYDGTTSSCTYASGTTTVYNTTNWYKVSDSASCSADSAIYTAVLVDKLLGVTAGTASFSVTLSCDKNGNLS